MSGKSYFINNYDSYLGRGILGAIAGDAEVGEEQDNRVVATYSIEEDHRKDKGISKVLWRHKKLLYKKYVREVDVVIYDTLQGSGEEVLRAVEAFSEAKEIEGEKVLILVSNVLTWSANGVNEKEFIEEPKEEEIPEDAEGNEEDAAEEMDENDAELAEEKPKVGELQENIIGGENNEEGLPEGEEENKEDEGSVEEEPTPREPVFIPWTDNDYEKRTPLEKYQRIKELEDIVLNLKVEGLKTYVISAGLIYGNGENYLKKYLEIAWKQSPNELEYLGDGTNLVPSIHIKDLSRFILKIAELAPEKKYHFAFDAAKDRSLKQLIGGISRTIGSGLIKSVESTDQIDENNIDLFKINLWALGSSLLMVHPKDEEPKAAVADDQETPEEEANEELIEFEWHSKLGLESNGKKILNEFNSLCGHKSLKILITGAQKSRKTEFCSELSKHYSIPIINFEDIFKCLEIKCTDSLLKDYHEEKAKIEEILNSKQINLELNETTKVLYRCIKWRLSQNDCLNRGFVIDDLPLGISDLRIVFNRQKKALKRIIPKEKRVPKKKKQEVVEEGQDDALSHSKTQEEKEGSKLDEDDQDQIDAEGQDEEVEDEEGAEEEKGDEQDEGESDQPDDEEEGEVGEDGEGEEGEEGEEEGEGEEGEENLMKKREPFYVDSLIFFEKENPEDSYINWKSDDRIEELYTWSAQESIESFNCIPENDNSYEIMENLRSFIERNGRPNNYLAPKSELIEKHMKHFNSIEETRKAQESQRFGQESLLLSNAKQQRIDTALGVADKIEKSEKLNEDIEKIPTRKYLMDSIYPVINSGLLKVVQIQPDDPVDFLAEYVYRRSYEY